MLHTSPNTPAPPVLNSYRLHQMLQLVRDVKRSDGVLPLADLAGAVAEARAAITSDPRQVALKRTIAEIRARALAEAQQPVVPATARDSGDDSK
jgi:hypothetical protein